MPCIKHTTALLLVAVVSLGSSLYGTAGSQAASLKTSILTYRLDTGDFPTEAQGLEVLIHNPGVPNWDGPYIDADALPVDPWDHEYRYRLVNGVPVIDSAGPDGEFDTGDDIGTSGHGSPGCNCPLSWVSES